MIGWLARLGCRLWGHDYQLHLYQGHIACRRCQVRL